MLAARAIAQQRAGKREDETNEEYEVRIGDAMPRAHPIPIVSMEQANAIGERRERREREERRRATH